MPRSNQEAEAAEQYARQREEEHQRAQADLEQAEAALHGHGEASYTMRPGDAVQLDGEGAHGPQELVELPIRFLSVTAYGDHVPD